MNKKPFDPALTIQLIAEGDCETLDGKAPAWDSVVEVHSDGDDDRDGNFCRAYDLLGDTRAAEIYFDHWRSLVPDEVSR